VQIFDEPGTEVRVADIEVVDADAPLLLEELEAHVRPPLA
jgi:hypothetical protein